MKCGSLTLNVKKNIKGKFYIKGCNNAFKLSFFYRSLLIYKKRRKYMYFGMFASQRPEIHKKAWEKCWSKQVQHTTSLTDSLSQITGFRMIDPSPFGFAICNRKSRLPNKTMSIYDIINLYHVKLMYRWRVCNLQNQWLDFHAIVFQGLTTAESTQLQFHFWILGENFYIMIIETLFIRIPDKNDT